MVADAIVPLSIDVVGAAGAIQSSSVEGFRVGRILKGIVQGGRIPRGVDHSIVVFGAASAIQSFSADEGIHGRIRRGIDQGGRIHGGIDQGGCILGGSSLRLR